MPAYPKIYIICIFNRKHLTKFNPKKLLYICKLNYFVTFQSLEIVVNLFETLFLSIGSDTLSSEHVRKSEWDFNSEFITSCN